MTLIPPVPFTDRSGAITTGGTAQDIYPSDETPKNYIGLQNKSDTVMYFDFDRPATADTGYDLVAGAAWENPPGIVPRGRLSILCATTGKKFVCKTA